MVESIPPIRRLIGFVIVLLWLLCPLAARAEGEPRVSCQEVIHPGEAFYLRVDAPATAETLRVDFAERTLWPELQTSENGKTAMALLAVGLKHSGEEEALRVEMSGPAGEPVVVERRIKVEARAYPEEHLTVHRDYATPPPETQERIKREREMILAALSTISPKRLWDGDWKRPVPGIVTSPFGLRRFFNEKPRSPHSGTDMRAAIGQPVHCMANGVVLLAKALYFAGNCVYVDHGQGVISAYAHLSEIQVAEGDQVSRAQVLGLAGYTGRVTGPHLHFGVSVLGRMVDGAELLTKAWPLAESPDAGTSTDRKSIP